MIIDSYTEQRVPTTGRRTRLPDDDDGSTVSGRARSLSSLEEALQERERKGDDERDGGDGSAGRTARAEAKFAGDGRHKHEARDLLAVRGEVRDESRQGDTRVVTEDRLEALITPRSHAHHIFNVGGTW